VASDRLGRVRRVAGADLAYSSDGTTCFAAVVVLDATTLETVETATAVLPVTFPYVPGYLSFREAPAVCDAWSRIRVRPALLFVDGHGLAHPRRFGVASHLGVGLDVPTVGVAKSILVGHADDPGPRRGSTRPLVHRDETVGMAVRTRDRVAPVYVSVGHRIGLDTAVRFTLSCGDGYRLPAPTRRADRFVAALRRERS